MRVEFIGGPWDGDVREVDDTARYIRVPLRSRPEPWQFSDDAQYVTAALDYLRVGEYSPKGNPREFIWRGEP